MSIDAVLMISIAIVEKKIKARLITLNETLWILLTKISGHLSDEEFARHGVVGLEQCMMTMKKSAYTLGYL